MNDQEETHVTRMIREKSQLAEKLSKLDNFLVGEKFQTLNKFQKYLLQQQKDAMSRYLDILTARIESDKFVMYNSQPSEERVSESSEHN